MTPQRQFPGPGPDCKAGIKDGTGRKHRFVLLAAFTFIAVLITIWAGDCWGDYRHHAAVVRELTTHLVHPRNQVVNLGNSSFLFAILGPPRLFSGEVSSHSH